MTEYRYPCPHCEGELIITAELTGGIEPPKPYVYRVEHSQTIKLQVKV